MINNSSAVSFCAKPEPAKYNSKKSVEVCDSFVKKLVTPLPASKLPIIERDKLGAVKEALGPGNSDDTFIRLGDLRKAIDKENYSNGEDYTSSSVTNASFSGQKTVEEKIVNKIDNNLKYNIHEADVRKNILWIISSAFDKNPKYSEINNALKNKVENYPRS